MMNDFTSNIQCFDSIKNTVDGASVVVTAGDDTISSSSSGNIPVQYNSGDGNDVINGFTENDTLFFDGGTYSIDSSGKNAVENIRDGYIFSKGTANSDDLNDTEAETFVESLQRRTEAGYPVIAGLFFHPNEYHGFKNLGSNYYVKSETLTINSSDGLQLTGYHYTPKNPNDKWVILVHGYGHNHRHMNGFARQYLTNNYHVLMIDQRAAGDSQGEWLTMGAAEGEDVALWTHKIAELNPNAKITLHGVSMGAATAMLAAANSNLTNVTSLIEDCGYTSVMKLVDIVKSAFPALADPEFVSLVNDTSKKLTGHKLTEAAPIDSIGNATMPSMFITGTADQVISLDMLESLYSASGAEVKEIFTVEGATHGLSGLKDSIGYGNAVFRFNAEAAGEGWITSNVTDNISLRGTKYNDTIKSGGNYVTIIGGTGDDIIKSSGNYVTITGGTGDDTIDNFCSSDMTINGGAGDDVITFDGSYRNSIVYNAKDGNDTIVGFDSIDTLQIASGKITNTSVNGNDFIIYVGKGSIRLQNKAGQTLNLKIGKGKVTTLKAVEDKPSWKISDTTATYGNKFQNLVTLSGLKSGTKANNLTLKNKTVTLASGIIGSEGASVKGGGYTFVMKGAGKLTNVGAAATFKGSSGKDTLLGGNGNDTLYGNNGNDYLSGGKGNDYLDGGRNNDKILGGKGNDTLTGGAGNDTLTGGAGKDIFVYSAGKDVITDYTAGQDKIKISETIKKTTYENEDVIFTIGSGTLTVKNGKGKKISIEDANGKTSTKTYSNSTVSQLWFAEENNFVSADNLSSIVKNDSMLIGCEIDTKNLKNLTQQNDFITFSANEQKSF